jgi:MFS transporter, DHA1 family, tetracycline resistance protein
MIINKSKRNLIIVISVVLMDFIGVGMILPILPALFHNQSGYYSKLFSTEVLNIIYSALIASYPIAQLFGAPIFGYWSDIYGKKRMLFYSIIGTALSYAIFAYGIIFNNLFMLFFARLCDGFTGGNIFLAQSSINQSASPKKRTKYIGYLNIAMATGIIFGPIIGWLFTELKFFDLNPLSNPFLVTTVISLINALVLHFYFVDYTEKESKKKNITTNTVHPFRVFTKIFLAFRNKYILPFLVISFTTAFIFNLIVNFIPKILSDKFNLSQRNLAILTAYIGICAIVSVVGLLPYLEKRYKRLNILIGCLFVITAFLIISLFPFQNIIWYYFILPFVFGALMIIPVKIIVILTDSTKSQGQMQEGEILGINQSIQSIASTSPLIVGLISIGNLFVAIFICAIISLITAIWTYYYLYVKHSHMTTKNHPE